MFSRRFVRGMTFVVVVAACTLAGWSAAGQEEEPNPFVAQAKAALKDPDKPFTLVVKLRVKEGMGEQFEAAFAKALKPTRAEKGCRGYELSRDAKTPGQYLAYEKWQDLAALRAHIKAPHFQALAAEVGGMLDGPPVAEVYVPAGE